MSRATRFGAALAAATVLSATFVPSAGAQAATYNVSIGRFIPNIEGAESMRFFPDRLTVHRGDVLRFRTAGVHTATIIPTEQDVQQWMTTKAGGQNKDYSLVASDPDESATAGKLNTAVVSASSVFCGTPGLAPCGYDGTSVVHSGLPLVQTMDFSVIVDVPSGTSFTIVDLMAPQARLSVTVVPSSAAKSDPTAEADDSGYQADADQAAELHREFNQPTKSKKNGKILWNAYAGIDRGNVAIRGMYPKRLVVRKGQRVRWHFSELTSSMHSVAIPAFFGEQLSGLFPQVLCDRDGDAGTAPDEMPDSPDAPFCEDVAQLELDLPTEFTSMVGNRKWTKGADLEASGIRGGGAATASNPYVVRFPKKTARKGQKYVCMLHPSMDGKVVVKKVNKR